MKIVVDIIHGDKRHDEFMHHCDVFEGSKVLGEYDQMVVSGDDGVDLENLTTNLKNAYEQSGRVISFLSIRQVGPTLTNDYKRYIRPNTSSISNGKQWGMFHEMLKRLDYEVETNERMQVLSAKLVW